MRTCVLIFSAVLAQAQSTTSRYEVDINGRRVETERSSSAGGTRSEYTQSINGRPVPLEQTEEKIVSEGPGGKVVERIVRKFDPTGRQNGMERVLIEEEKLAGGGLNVKQTVWRSDINGAMREAERRQAETRISGSSTTTQTVVSRPDINGSFSTAERRSAVAEKNGDTVQSTEVLQRRDTNGQFYDASREVKVVTKQGDRTSEQTTSYAPDVTGRLDVASQSVSTSTKQPDGTLVKEVNVYSNHADGHAVERGSGTQIQEQQIVERKKATDGSIIESVSIRRPSVSDPSRLGSAQKVQETVCRGKCD